MNLEVYEPDIRCKTRSLLGNYEETIPHDCVDVVGNAVLKAFVDDDDVQEIVVSSSSLGFVKTYRKFYKSKNGQ